MRGLGIVGTGVVVLLAGGCVSNPHSHGGQFVSEYQPGSSPPLGWTPYQATYALYHWRPRPDDPPPQTWIPAAGEEAGGDGQ